MVEYLYFFTDGSMEYVIGDSYVLAGDTVRLMSEGKIYHYRMRQLPLTKQR